MPSANGGVVLTATAMAGSTYTRWTDSPNPGGNLCRFGPRAAENPAVRGTFSPRCSSSWSAFGSIGSCTYGVDLRLPQVPVAGCRSHSQGRRARVGFCGPSPG